MTGLARLVLVAATAAWLVVDAADVERARARWFWTGLAIHLAASGAYLVLALATVRGRLAPRWWEAFGLALALRLLVLPLAPALSDDIYRYLHEGRLVLAGENPYEQAPAAAPAGLRGPYWERINHPEVPAAYPPAMQFAMAAGAALSPEPWGMKLVFGGLDLMVFVLLWYGLPRLGGRRELAVLHGWCPLLVLEFAGEGHGDSLAVLFCVAAVLAWGSRRGWLAGATLAVAAAGKLLPALLVPFALREPGRVRLRPGWAVAVTVGFVAVLVALYLPFWTAPQRLFAGTSEYVARWRANESLFVVLHWLAACLVETAGLESAPSVWLREPQRLSKILLALIVGSLALMWWRRRLPLPRVAFWLMVVFIALTPTLHPWYVGFLVPWLCLYPNPWLLALTATVYLAYHVLPGYLAGAGWHEQPVWRIVEYAPFYAGVLKEMSSTRGER